MERRNSIHIDLTKEQKEQLREAVGQNVSALEFNVDALEPRIAPAKTYLVYTMENVVVDSVSF
jgi:hypothetical protein